MFGMAAMAHTPAMEAGTQLATAGHPMMTGRKNGNMVKDGKSGHLPKGFSVKPPRQHGNRTGAQAVGRGFVMASGMMAKAAAWEKDGLMMMLAGPKAKANGKITPMVTSGPRAKTLEEHPLMTGMVRAEAITAGKTLMMTCTAGARASTAGSTTASSMQMMRKAQQQKAREKCTGNATQRNMAWQKGPARERTIMERMLVAHTATWEGISLREEEEEALLLQQNLLPNPSHRKQKEGLAATPSRLLVRARAMSGPRTS